MAAATLRERVHEIVEELPESQLPAVDYFLRALRYLGPIAAVETRGHPLPEEERVALVDSLMGKYAGTFSTLEEFSRMRQEEIELEEARWTPEYKGLQPSG